MFAKNSILFENEDDSSSIIDIPYSPIRLPITDHNINSFLKNQNNKFINISSKYENEEENKLKLEEIFDRNHAYIFENLFKFSIDETEDKVKNNINLEESKEQKISQDMINNSINNDIIIAIDSLPEQNKSIKAKKIFLTIYPKKVSLFTKAKTEINFLTEKANNELIGNKRRRNKEDDIRRMIGRRFFNDILLNLINDLLKEYGSIILFEKIQQDVVYDLVKKNNKKLLDMSLKQIFVKKELYRGKKMEKYFHNLKLINLLKSQEYDEIRERTQIDRILNMKYNDLFQEYISSNEFIEEINRLKNNKTKFDDSYVEKYIYYSFNFIKNFIE